MVFVAQVVRSIADDNGVDDGYPNDGCCGSEKEVKVVVGRAHVPCELRKIAVFFRRIFNSIWLICFILEWIYIFNDFF